MIPMHDLNYMPVAAMSRELAAAKIHLLVWGCIFYFLAAVVIAFTAFVFYSGFHPSRSASGESLAPWGAFLVFMGGLTFILGAMGRRCKESRKYMAALDAEKFRWATEAFNALFAFAVLAFVVAVLIAAATITSGISLGIILPILGVISILVILTGWTCWCLSRAGKTLAAIAERQNP